MILNIKKGILFAAMILITVISLNAQTILTIEGKDFTNSDTAAWLGVDIPRSVPTKLTFKNNSITSKNGFGYLLQAGDEAPVPANNNLDGSTIIGNKFKWIGEDNLKIITHGLFTGYNENVTVMYNYLDKVPYGIIFKSGTDNGVNMTFTSGGCAYNICRNGKFAGRVKGINGIRFYNNTFYSGDGKGWYLLLITSNRDRAVPAPSTGTRIFNNIFYSTTQIPMIKIDSACLSDFECDNNIYWCTAGEPIFVIEGKTFTFSQWRALGYDKHSVVMDPQFMDFVNFIPEKPLSYGKDLGPEWKAGLSTNVQWKTGMSPSLTNQYGPWQVGAILHGKKIRNKMVKK